MPLTTSFRIFDGDDNKGRGIDEEVAVETRSLQEDLLAIDGVEHAEVDGDSSAPSGLRIRVSHDADQKVVGESIRRVLSAHGLGTDTRLPGEPATSGDEPRRRAGQTMASVSEIAAQAAPVSVATLAAVDDEVETMEEDFAEGDRTTYEPLLEPSEGERRVSRTPQTTPSRVTIEKVSVEEGRTGIVVTVVASDGQSETELARSTDGGVEHAVVLAAARLAAPGAPDPVVIEIEERRVEGVDIVMIVLDNNGVVKAGSAVIGAGQAFALGRATWAAMLN